MTEITIPYRANKTLYIFSITFFSVLTWFMAKFAVNNDNGLILNHIFELSTQGASIFYWVIAGTGFSLASLSTLILFKSMRSKREIIITDVSITAPKSIFSKVDITIDYKDIQSITMQTINKNILLHIEHPDGKLTIPKSMLPNKNAFDDLVSTIKTKGLSSGDENTVPSENASSQENALLNAIKEKKKSDPMIGIKIGSKEITDRLLQALTNDKGVHIESLLAILGSLAGYSCHAAVRETLVDTGKQNENDAFTIIECKDGSTYYFGDLPNQPLVGGNVSIWGSIAGMLKHLGIETVPDIKQTFTHVTNTIGSDSFGIPQVPDKHKPNDLPINYVKSMWQPLLPIMDKFCETPMQRPILLGVAVKQAIEMGKDIISPTIAAQLVMECAVPMSKIGPDWLDRPVSK